MSETLGTSKVRVRFAPSPTGYLHVGGARTALFNWLFARHNGGTFVLRIEDTDLARSTDESTQAILDGLSWLGIDWDEGPGVGGPHEPYFQTKRLQTYRDYADRLIAAGRAYKCYCSPEELDARREQALREGRPPMYDGRCRMLTDEDRRRLEEDEGRTPVVRFHAFSEGTLEFRDLIHGKVRFENKVVDDFVIIKSDGVPTYNFAAVIDDALMEITHVIRGEDHLSNTPKQIQLYRALNLPTPQFAHIPMILGSDRTRLSKRHGATSVMQYKEDGFLPEAMLNYLALLGWSYNATDNLFSKEQLIEYFTLDKVSKNPAVFDRKKLEWMNGVYLRQIDPKRLAVLAVPYLTQAGLIPPEPGEETLALVEKVVSALQTRIRELSEVSDAAGYFFTDSFRFEELAREMLKRQDLPKLLDALANRLEGLNDFSPEAIELVFQEVLAETGLKPGELIHPVRAAVTGRKVSPGIYEVLSLLGRTRTCQRLREGARLAAELTAVNA